MEMVGHRLWASTILCFLLLGQAGADIAAPVDQCDATGCNLNNAYGTWPDRISCEVHQLDLLVLVDVSNRSTVNSLLVQNCL